MLILMKSVNDFNFYYAIKSKGVLKVTETKPVMIPHFEINLRKSVRSLIFMYISLVERLIIELSQNRHKETV